MMARPYLPFVDWLKAFGVALIVFDHVAHWMLPWATPPFYPKQLGVAMFESLMRERAESGGTEATRSAGGSTAAP